MNMQIKNLFLILFLIIPSSAYSLEITYPMFETCYLDPLAIPHQVTRNFIQTMKDAMLAGKGVVFNRQPAITSKPRTWKGFYITLPVTQGSCTINYVAGTSTCNISRSRSKFWELSQQVTPIFYDEFVQNNINLGTTNEQFEKFMTSVTYAINDANNGYVEIEGFGKIRNTESGLSIGYSGFEFVNTNSFMVTTENVPPYEGNCASFVGKGKSNPEVLGINDIIAGGFKIKNITKTATEIPPLGTNATLSILAITEDYYTLQYQYPNDSPGEPKTIDSSGTDPVLLTSNNGEQLSLVIFNKDLLPTAQTPTITPIQKSFRIGTTGVKRSSTYPRLKLEPTRIFQYTCKYLSGTYCSLERNEVTSYTKVISPWTQTITPWKDEFYKTEYEYVYLPTGDYKATCDFPSDDAYPFPIDLMRTELVELFSQLFDLPFELDLSGNWNIVLTNGGTLTGLLTRIWDSNCGGEIKWDDPINACDFTGTPGELHAVNVTPLADLDGNGNVDYEIFWANNDNTVNYRQYLYVTSIQ